MKVNVVSRKFVKPCTPTPKTLKNYNISFIDELSPTMNVGVLLFYPSKPKRIRHLEESLSKILAQFYPLAGRYISEHHLVDCNDEGAEFVQAEAVHVELIDLVGERELEQLNGLLPRRFFQADEATTDPLLSMQITELRCGGLAIGISVSHRIFDAASVGTFIAAWSNASNPGGEITINPTLYSPSTLLSSENHSYNLDIKPSTGKARPKIVAKRFSFNMAAITSLTSKLRPKAGKQGISRVRVVSAVIARALIGLDGAKHGGEWKPAVIVQAVNVRGRTTPPLPKHSCGNFILGSATRCMGAAETKDIGIQELVYLMGDAAEKTIADCAEIFSPGKDGRDIFIDALEDFGEKLQGGGVNVMMFSDWSKFGFYEADFGWGNPVGASIGAMPGEKIVVLMDKKESDGIEAWVHLDQDDMPCFEEDEDIKLFTT